MRVTWVWVAKVLVARVHVTQVWLARVWLNGLCLAGVGSVVRYLVHERLFEHQGEGRDSQVQPLEVVDSRHRVDAAEEVEGGHARERALPIARTRGGGCRREHHRQRGVQQLVVELRRATADRLGCSARIGAKGEGRGAGGRGAEGRGSHGCLDELD